MLSPCGYYLQPQVVIFRQPVYLWQNQQRISEHLEQQAGGGLEAGRTFSRNFQMAANYRAQVVRWHLVGGDDGTPVLSATAQTAVAHLSYDTIRSKGRRVVPRCRQPERSNLPEADYKIPQILGHQYHSFFRRSE